MAKKGTIELATKPLNRSLSAAKAPRVTDVELLLHRHKAARIAVKGDDGKCPGGDFRSSECVALLKQADLVVTKPPFSLFGDASQTNEGQH